MRESPEKMDWGWLSYKRLLIKNNNGEQLYEARLRADHDLFNFTLVVVQFWGRHPIKKLRAACSEKRTSEELVRFLQEPQPWRNKHGEEIL